MKILITTLITILSLINLNGQINGNGNIVTKSFSTSDFYRVEAGLYAEILIDMNLPTSIMIEAENNIIEYIGKSVKKGILTLDQTKWIEPSKRIKITVGAPDLREVMMDTHDELQVINVNGELVKLEANIGKITISGEATSLKIKSESGNVDAAKLLCNTANIIIKEDGNITLNVSKAIECNIKENGLIKNVNPNNIQCKTFNNSIINEPTETRYINFKIKNNSMSRKHFVVIGPKPNGSSFSYGFPMMPGAKRKETWTIGTKIYQENSVGIRKLLVEIDADDENTTVKLF